MTDQAALYLAENVQQLRKRKGFSQKQLAELAELPRSTLTNIESGTANPSLRNLSKLSQALGIGIEELLSRPRHQISHIPAAEVPVQKRSGGLATVHKLLPDRIKSIEIDRFELKAGASVTGHPHVAGTKEYLMVLSGELVVHVAGEKFHIQQGDVLAFPGDQRHSYRNPAGGSKGVAISVVIPIPATV